MGEGSCGREDVGGLFLEKGRAGDGNFGVVGGYQLAGKNLLPWGTEKK